jgi:hypothetical protein
LHGADAALDARIVGFRFDQSPVAVNAKWCHPYSQLLRKLLYLQHL